MVELMTVSDRSGREQHQQQQ